MTVHTILIVLHAAAAALCFTFGVMTLLPHVTNPSKETLFRYYFVALILEGVETARDERSREPSMPLSQLPAKPRA